MNVTVLSCFRDAAHYVERYCEQMDGLQTALQARGDSLHLVLGYGDSVDGTGAALFDECSNRFCAHLIDVSHGGPYHGNIVHPERFQQLAGIWGRLWQHIPPEADAVVFCEGDLVWRAETLLTLVDRLDDYAAIAPMVWLTRRGYPPPFFYDVWAYRKDGAAFAQRAPFFDGWPPAAPVPIDSAGSCVAFRGEVARGLVWSEKNLIVGLCEQVYAQGGSLWLEPNVSVQHL